jgi:hypothetical protein
MASETSENQTRPRFTVHLGERDVYVFDDEFHWDAALLVSGDFADKNDCIRFAQGIADALNKSAILVPKE